MSNFKTRLVEEQAQLEERRNKLNDFIRSHDHGRLDQHQKDLLAIQRGAMLTYNECLEARLQWLKEEPAPVKERTCETRKYFELTSIDGPCGECVVEAQRPNWEPAISNTCGDCGSNSCGNCIGGSNFEERSNK